MCVGGIKRGHCRVPFRALPFKEIAVAGIYYNRLPSVVGAQIFAVAMRRIDPQGSRQFNTGRRSTRPRDFRE